MVCIFSEVYPSTTFIDLMVNKIGQKYPVYLFVKKFKSKDKVLFSSQLKVINASQKGVRKFVICIFLSIYFYSTDTKFFKSCANELKHINDFKLRLTYLYYLYLLRWFDIRLIHVQWLDSMEIPLIFKKVSNCKILLSLRGYQVSIGVSNKNLHKKYKDYINAADVLHSISDDLTNQAILLGAAPNKIIKIKPAIDLNKFKFRGTKKIGGLILITVARLHWKKGLNYALLAMYELKKQNIEFKYFIVGSGDMYQSLMFQIIELGLEKHVFLKGQLSQLEIIQLLRVSDIYIQPSVQEGFCNAVIEAQAIGLPCIVTDAEGLSENIEDGKTGILVPKRDPISIVNAILLICSYNSDKVFDIQNNCNSRAIGNFDINTQIISFINIYNKLM